MAYLIAKCCLTAGIVVGVSELAKRSTTMGALLAALPIVSILALIWLYRDTRDIEKVIRLSDGIFFMVLPTLVFFLLLSGLLRRGVAFAPAMTSPCVVMILVYLGYAYVARKLGLPL